MYRSEKIDTVILIGPNCLVLLLATFANAKMMKVLIATLLSQIKTGTHTAVLKTFLK